MIVEWLPDPKMTRVGIYPDHDLWDTPYPHGLEDVTWAINGGVLRVMITANSGASFFMDTYVKEWRKGHTYRVSYDIAGTFGGVSGYAMCEPVGMYPGTYVNLGVNWVGHQEAGHVEYLYTPDATYRVGEFRITAKAYDWGDPAAVDINVAISNLSVLTDDDTGTPWPLHVWTGADWHQIGTPGGLLQLKAAGGWLTEGTGGTTTHTLKIKTPTGWATCGPMTGPT